MAGEDVDVMQWDIALANLAKEACQKKAGSLTLDDFNELAKKYQIRFDDIMVTMFELVIHGEWTYEGEREISRSALNELYVNGRLHRKDLALFTGEWHLAS